MTERPEIVRHRDGAALAEGAAALVAATLGQAIAQRGRAGLALAGGSTPRALHHALRGKPIDWSAVHVYFGDERCVAVDDPDSNYRMACEALLDHVPIPRTHVHRIEGELPPGEAAARYADVIASAPPLDLVLLGMGDDGHVASIFPATPEPAPDASVIATTSPKPPPDRVSLTLRAIAAAREVVLMLSGAGKAARLAEVAAELRAGRPTLPAARVRSASGPPRWLVDEAAASRLEILT